MDRITVEEEKEKFKLEHVPKEWKLVTERRAQQQDVDVDQVIRHGVGHDFKKDEDEKREKAEALKDRKDQLSELKEILKAIKKEKEKP